jgi:TrmH family RNA methyltransferase
MEIKGIVLVRPKYSVNVASIARVICAFGINELIIIHDEENFKRLLKDKKIASGGVHVLNNAKRLNSLSEVKGKKIGTISIYDNKKYGFKLIPITELPKISGEYYLVFGSENYGLSKEELNMCDFVSTIPTNDKYGILNLAVSVTLYVYEIYKHKFLHLI